MLGKKTNTSKNQCHTQQVIVQSLAKFTDFDQMILLKISPCLSRYNTSKRKRQVKQKVEHLFSQN